MATNMLSYIVDSFSSRGNATPRPQSALANRTRMSSFSSRHSWQTATSSLESSTTAGKALEGTVSPSSTPPTNVELESQTTPLSTTTANHGSGSSPKQPRSCPSKMQAFFKPSEDTIYSAILGTADGMTVPFAVMASLAGVSDARLVMLAGLAELIAGAISMGAGGLLGAKSDEERAEHQKRCIAKQVVTEPDAAIDALTASLSTDLPTCIIGNIRLHYETLSTTAKVDMIMRFKCDPEPSPAEPYRAAFTFFLTYFAGLPALIPYIVVRRDQVNLAFYISIGITVILSFAYGWAKTGYNVGFTGTSNVARGIRGGLMFFGVVALAAVLSVVIIRGIGHQL